MSNAVVDQRLKNIASGISTLLEQSRAKNTHEKYKLYYERWSEWCQLFEEVQEFPARAEHVTLFIASLVQDGETYPVISSCCHSIKHFHLIANKPDLCDNKLTTYIMEAAKRICHQKVQKKKQITGDHLQRVYEKIGGNQASLPHLREFTFMVISYAGFLRYSESSNLKVQDISFEDRYVKIHIRKSKTYQYRNGNWVCIAKTGLQICPVSTLRRYMARAEW